MITLVLYLIFGTVALVVAAFFIRYLEREPVSSDADVNIVRAFWGGYNAVCAKCGAVIIKNAKDERQIRLNVGACLSHKCGDGPVLKLG